MCPLRVTELQNEVVGTLVVSCFVVSVDINNVVVVVVVIEGTVVLVLVLRVDVGVVDERGRLEHLQMGKPSSRVHSLYLK
jgi:hypothetical protein